MNVIDFLEFFTDINVIQHVVDKDKKFSDEFLFFKFSEAVIGSKLTDQDFLTRIRRNFTQFKIVFKFVANPENVNKFYDHAFSGKDGIDIRNRTYHLKTYKSVFLGNEIVSWIQKHYNNLGLNRYGAVILGECFRQLHAFDHSHAEHSLKDEQLFYKMRDEESFYSGILSKYYQEN